MTPQAATAGAHAGLSAQNTRLAFQRTRLGADRTLMAVMRTSLSVVAFGITAFHFVQRLPGMATHAHAGRVFGLALVGVGVMLQALGIWSHARFMIGLRRERAEMVSSGVMAGSDRFPYSVVLAMALLLLLVGVSAGVGLVIEGALQPSDTAAPTSPAEQNNS